MVIVKWTKKGENNWFVPIYLGRKSGGMSYEAMAEPLWQNKGRDNL